MEKRYDITDKLSFNENPVIVIKGKEAEVDASATAVLQIMNLAGNIGDDPSNVIKMIDLLFTDEGKRVINGLRLNFEDLQKVIEVAMALATGEDPDEGETEPEEAPENNGTISFLTGI